MGTIVKPVTWTKRGIEGLEPNIYVQLKNLEKKKALEIAHKIIDSPGILENADYDFKNIGPLMNHLTI